MPACRAQKTQGPRGWGVGADLLPSSPSPNFLKGQQDLGHTHPGAGLSPGQPAGQGEGAPVTQTSEKPPLVLGSTNRGFRTSSFLAKSRAYGSRQRGDEIGRAHV